MRFRGVRRTEDGVEVVIGVDERDALRSLPVRLRAIVDGEDASMPAEEISRRLFPSAYDDPDADAEWRGLARDDLVQQRLDTLGVFTRTLDGGTARGRRWHVQLTGDEAEAWLAVVNDGRLALASIVGIEDESCWEQGPDVDDPASLMLFYLGWLEEELVSALSGGLDEAARGFDPAGPPGAPDLTPPDPDEPPDEPPPSR